MVDDCIVKQTNYDMGPELCSERPGGMLKNGLRQYGTPFTSRLSPKDYDKKNDTNADMNLESGFGLNGKANTVVDDSSYGILPIDMGVKSQDDVFEDLDILDNEIWSWLDFPLTGPLHVSKQGNESQPTKRANISDGTMAATTPNETDLDWDKELVLSPITIIPVDTDHGLAQQIVDVPFAITSFKQDHDWVQQVRGSSIAVTLLEQDHDWALGYIPSFS